MGTHGIYNNTHYVILSDIPASETGYLRQIRCRCPELLQPWDRCSHGKIRSNGTVTQSIIDREDDELISLTFLRSSFVCEECGAAAIAWDPAYPESESITPEAREHLAKQVIAEYYSSHRLDIVPLLRHYIQTGLECLTGTYRERFSDILSWAPVLHLRMIPADYRNRTVYLVTGSPEENGGGCILLTILPDMSEDTLQAFREKIPHPEEIRSVMTDLNDPILPRMRALFPHAAVTYSKDSVTRLFEQYSGEPEDPSRKVRIHQAKQLFQRIFSSGSEILRSEIDRWEDKMLLDETLTTRSRNLLRQLLEQLLASDLDALGEVPLYSARWLDGEGILAILRLMEDRGISYLDAEMMVLRSDATEYQTESMSRKTGFHVDPGLLSVEYQEDSSLYLFSQM